MLRWFEEKGTDSDVVISSRIRLARNVKNYNFSLKLDDTNAKHLVEELGDKLCRVKPFSQYMAFNFDDLDEYQKQAMKERHVISGFLLSQKYASGFVSEDENIAVMINEEDHIRIQSYVAGSDIAKAFKKANEIDDIIGKVVDYAYSDNYGYLTTCPSSVGTGLKASYMLHLPALSATDKIAGLIKEVGRFGLEIRGVYNDGQRSNGEIYQISNQITLGHSEEEIIDNLTHITKQIIDQERSLRHQRNTKQRTSALDTFYRSYGVLKYARKMNLRDGMLLLSQLRLGLATELVKAEGVDESAVYQLMIGIQPANLQLLSNDDISGEELDEFRAEFIRENIPEIH